MFHDFFPQGSRATRQPWALLHNRFAVESQTFRAKGIHNSVAIVVSRLSRRTAKSNSNRIFFSGMN